MTKQNKYKRVYRLDYATDLQLMGHKVVMTSPNPKNSNLTMWIFEVDDTFDADLKNLQRGAAAWKE